MPDPIGRGQPPRESGQVAGVGLNSTQQKQLDQIIQELSQTPPPSPPFDKQVGEINDLINNSSPPLSPRAINQLNQALGQLQGGAPFLPQAVQSLQGIENQSTLTPRQLTQLQNIIDRIKSGDSDGATTELNQFLNSVPPLSPYEKNCVNAAIGQVQGMPSDAIVSLHGLQSQSTLDPTQLSTLGKIIDDVENGSPPFTAQIAQIEKLLNSQPPLSDYEKDSLNEALGQLKESGGEMSGFAIVSLQNLLPM